MIYCIILIMTFLGSIASFFLKKAASKGRIIAIIKNHNLYLGGFLYLVSAMINIYILRFLDYSVVLPLTSLTYVWTIIISRLKLREKLSRKKIFGTILIFFGAMLISR